MSHFNFPPKLCYIQDLTSSRLKWVACASGLTWPERKLRVFISVSDGYTKEGLQLYTYLQQHLDLSYHTGAPQQIRI